MRFREHVEEMQRAKIRQVLEELDCVGHAVVGDPSEELGVYYDGFKIWESGGKGGEEAWRVAHAEELEREGFDCGGEGGGDVVGLGEEGLVFVEFDVGGESQGAETGGFGWEVGEGEGLEGDLCRAELLALERWTVVRWAYLCSLGLVGSHSLACWDF